MESQSAVFRILVLGGTGRTGRHVIRQALQARYKVRALTRNLTKAPKFQEGDVEWIQGDSTDPLIMKKAVQGQNIIISTVGPSWFGKTTLYSDTVRAVIDAIDSKERPMRFLGVTASWDVSVLPWYQKLMAKLMKGLQEDHERMESILEKEGSQLQWTVVRPFELKEHEKTETYVVLPEDHTEQNINPLTYTGDLADFMLKEGVANKWVGKKVTLCYKK